MVTRPVSALQLTSMFALAAESAAAYLIASFSTSAPCSCTVVAVFAAVLTADGGLVRYGGSLGVSALGCTLNEVWAVLPCPSLTSTVTSMSDVEAGRLSRLSSATPRCLSVITETDFITGAAPVTVPEL